MTITPEIQELFLQVKTKLGFPIRPIQLEDDAMCRLLEAAIGDYSAFIQNWVIESNYLNLSSNRLNLSTPQDVAYAMTIRSMDWSRDWSEWFSKEVGLQQRGTKYELKKDFFQIEKGKQVYMIPAGREINKVLYITPSTTKAALYGNMGTLDGGFAGGYGQLGNMGMGIMNGGFFIGSMYDTALLSADLKYKNSMLRGDLAYKVTAGPDGTHLVHLLSTPGSKTNMLLGAPNDANWGWNRYQNHYCWYTYYDTANNDEAQECMLENRDTLHISPETIPFDKMRYELLNNPAQQQVRQLLFAECAITLGIIRGTYSGNISIPNAQVTMDYNMLLSQGEKEKERVFGELKERLDRMLPWNQMKNQADMMESMQKILSHKPLPFMIR